MFPIKIATHLCQNQPRYPFKTHGWTGIIFHHHLEGASQLGPPNLAILKVNKLVETTNLRGNQLIQLLKSWKMRCCTWHPWLPDAAQAVPRHHPRSRVGIDGKAPCGECETRSSLGWWILSIKDGHRSTFPNDEFHGNVGIGMRQKLAHDNKREAKEMSFLATWKCIWKEQKGYPSNRKWEG